MTYSTLFCEFFMKPDIRSGSNYRNPQIIFKKNGKKCYLCKNALSDRVLFMNTALLLFSLRSNQEGN